METTNSNITFQACPAQLGEGCAVKVAMGTIMQSSSELTPRLAEHKACLISLISIC